MNKTLLLAGAACFLSLNVNAAEIDVKPYVGLDYVYTSADFNYGYEELVAENYNSFNLNVGTKFNKNFGVEAFYQKSAREDKSVYGVVTTKGEFDAYGVDFAGYLPLTENLEGIASIGLGHYTFKVSALGGSDDESNMGYRLGLGAQYNINENVGVRVMGRFVGIDDGDDGVVNNLTEFTAGIRYTF